jgi:hypothetical protein
MVWQGFLRKSEERTRFDRSQLCKGRSVEVIHIPNNMPKRQFSHERRVTLMAKLPVEAPPGRSARRVATVRRSTRGLSAALLASASLSLMAFPAHAASKAPTTKPSTKSVAKNALPVMNVTEVKSGKPFPLASVVDKKKPVLVWMWAPH